MIHYNLKAYICNHMFKALFAMEGNIFTCSDATVWTSGGGERALLFLPRHVKKFGLSSESE